MIVKIIGTNWYWSSKKFWQGWGKQIALATLFYLSLYWLAATEISPQQLFIQSGPITWSAMGR